MPRSKRSGKVRIDFLIYSILVAILVLLAIIGPFVVPHDPYMTDASSANLPFATDGYLLGTDNLGRCEFCRLLTGLNTALFSSLFVVVTVFVLGSLLGIIAGYFGGAVDRIVMWLVTTFQVFPSFLLAIVIAGFLGPGLTNACIALMVVYWTTYTRLARGLVMSLREQPFVMASQVIGCSRPRILLRHLVPNIMPQMIVTATSDIGSVIVSLAGLAFLGLGSQRPTADWGTMLNEAEDLILRFPNLMICASVAIIVVVLIWSLFGDALRDMLDTRMARRMGNGSYTNDDETDADSDAELPSEAIEGGIRRRRYGLLARKR